MTASDDLAREIDQLRLTLSRYPNNDMLIKRELAEHFLSLLSPHPPLERTEQEPSMLYAGQPKGDLDALDKSSPQGTVRDPGADLARIRAIIEAVDNRCMAADGPVSRTLEEMTQDEISRIYALSCGKPEDWRPL